MKIHKDHTKISKEEFLKLYNLGMGDTEIAKKYNCSREVVRDKRYSLRLISNIPRKDKKENINEIDMEIHYIKDQLRHYRNGIIRFENRLKELKK